METIVCSILLFRSIVKSQNRTVSHILLRRGGLALLSSDYIKLCAILKRQHRQYEL